MTEHIKDGGPAFPSPYTQPDNQGVTLRDYFAAKAMQAMISGWPDSIERPEIVKRAYQMADGMLAAREQQP